MCCAKHLRQIYADRAIEATVAKIGEGGRGVGDSRKLTLSTATQAARNLGSRRLKQIFSDSEST